MAWRGEVYQIGWAKKHLTYKDKENDLINKFNQWTWSDRETENYERANINEEWSAIGQIIFERHLERLRNSKDKSAQTRENFWY